MMIERIGNFRMVRTVSEGDQGALFHAVSDKSGERVAVRVQRGEAATRELTQRWQRAVQVSRLLAHPAVVRLIQAGRLRDGSVYLVQEQLPGETLAARLASRPRPPMNEVLRLGRQIATVLVAAHARGILHCALRPESLQLVPDPEAVGGERVKITDWGLARVPPGPAPPNLLADSASFLQRADATPRGHRVTLLGTRAEALPAGQRVTPMGQRAVAAPTGRRVTPVGERGDAAKSGPRVTPIGQPAAAAKSGPRITPIGQPVAAKSGPRITPIGQPVAAKSGPRITPIGQPAAAQPGQRVTPTGQRADAAPTGQRVTPMGQRADAGPAGQRVTPMGQRADAASSAELSDQDLSMASDNLIPTELADTDLAPATADQYPAPAPPVPLDSPTYLSPEQCRTAIPADNPAAPATSGDPAAVSDRVDVYALGVMLFQMAAGQLPFSGRAPSEIIAMHIAALPPKLEQRGVHAPAGLSNLVATMLIKEPSARPTMREVEERLQRLAAQQQLAQTMTPALRASQELALAQANNNATVERRAPAAPPAARVPPKAVWALALALILVAVGALWKVWGINLEPPPPTGEAAADSALPTPATAPEKRQPPTATPLVPLAEPVAAPVATAPNTAAATAPAATPPAATVVAATTSAGTTAATTTPAGTTAAATVAAATPPAGTTPAGTAPAGTTPATTAPATTAPAATAPTETQPTGTAPAATTPAAPTPAAPAPTAPAPTSAAAADQPGASPVSPAAHAATSTSADSRPGVPPLRDLRVNSVSSPKPPARPQPPAKNSAPAKPQRAAETAAATRDKLLAARAAFDRRDYAVAIDGAAALLKSEPEAAALLLGQVGCAVDNLTLVNRAYTTLRPRRAALATLAAECKRYSIELGVSGQFVRTKQR